MKNLKQFMAIVMVALLLWSCGGGTSGSSSSDGKALKDPAAKYIFYFIGDGMTAAQVQLADAALTSSAFRENYAAQTGVETNESGLHIRTLSEAGLATSSAANRYITDSAAAGTALATGSKTDVGVISKDPQGNILTSVAEKAKAKGMKVGIVSSVSIDHATPACFYAHTMSRSEYSEISDQLLTSGFDYFAGGSPKWTSKARTQGTDPATAYAAYCKAAEEQGYIISSTRKQFDQIGAGTPHKVIATLDMLAREQYSGDGAALPYTIDLDKQTSVDNQITLADFTRKGIELLENKDGFFMMVEGGKIDWACHANDAATCAYEVVAFDEAIGVALEFAAKHPRQTLIVVTGDHDCGGLGLGFAGTGYESAFDVIGNSKSSYHLFTEASNAKIAAGESFEALLKFACEQFGFTNDIKGEESKSVVRANELSDLEVKLLKEGYAKSRTMIGNATHSDEDIYFAKYGGYDPFTTTCTHLLNIKSGIDFTSYSHTAVPVMVFADGANSHIFSGYYDNTDIPKKIMQAAKL